MKMKIKTWSNNLFTIADLTDAEYNLIVNALCSMDSPAEHKLAKMLIDHYDAWYKGVDYE